MGRTKPESNPETTGVTRHLVSTLLLASCFLLVAGSCDNRKKEPIDVPQTNNTVEPKENVKKEPTFEQKNFEDVGPKAPTIVIVSGLKGYTEPCGCTLDIMLGGIDRLVAFFDDVRSTQSETLVLHAGDLFFESEVEPENEPQERARVDLVVEGVKRMKISYTIPGPKDFALGAPFYLEKLDASGTALVGSNLSIDGKPLPTTRAFELGGESIRMAGIADPKLFKEVKAVTVTDPTAALKSVKLTPTETNILLVAGDVEFARLHAKGFDFVVVSKPRETDQADPAGEAFTLEPYDQGRYVGLLKLFSPEKKGPFSNARAGSKSEIEKLDRQIERINDQIKKLPPATPGNEPEILLNLRARLDETKKKREDLSNSAIEVSETGPSFFWRTVPIEPGYREDDAMKTKRTDFNKSLKKLSQTVDRTIVEPKPGEAFCVGNQECAKCHADATAFWKTTPHSRAWATLEKRDKDYDHKCVGCHSVGYEKPGGSVIGKFQYDYDLVLKEGMPADKITKDLENVGCENCHGPGSAHRMQPLDVNGKPHNIVRDNGEATCGQCHVPEHSPKFNYPLFRKQIIGKGHGL